MTISGYHVHFYCTLEQLELAQSVRDSIVKDLKTIGGAGPVRNRPVGPHTLPMFEVWFGPEALGEVLPWVLLNRRGLSVLLHPETGNDYVDHTDRAVWIGEKIPLKLEVLR